VRRFWATLAILPLYAQERDLSNILVEAREHVLEAAEQLPRISCTQTIDRSYFKRANPPEGTPSCEQIGIDRKKARYKMKLYATDRIRVKVMMIDGREVFAWADPLKYELHDLESVLTTGPIGTGAFGAFYRNLFVNPEARYQFLGERSGKLAYGFRENTEVSHQVVKAGEKWVPTAHAGSFLIDPESLDLARFTVETSTLDAETNMCETSSTIDYHRVRIGAEDFLLPRHAESRDVLIDTGETTNAISYSACAAEIPPLTPPVKAASILPEKVQMVLALDDPIDTDTAAAGDLVSATVTKPVIPKDSFNILLDRGTRVRGRILNLAHRLEKSPQPVFVVTIAFDVVEINGVASPLHIQVDRARNETVLTDHSDRWPEDSQFFATNASRYVIPRGYESKWVTVK